MSINEDRPTLGRIAEAEDRTDWVTVASWQRTEPTVNRASSVIACPVCSTPAGEDCPGMVNHIGRGLAAAIERTH